MTKFLLVYGGGNPPADRAEGEAVMKSWIDWFTKLGPAVADGGNPTADMAKRISPNGNMVDATDRVVTGYSMLEAGSLAEAAQLAKGCPHLQSGGTVTVYEITPVM